MGFLFSKLSSLFATLPPSRILLLGLDDAGKTTILYKLKFGEIKATIPTIGFNVETISPVKGLSFTIWDVTGAVKIRPLWRHYFEDSKGLIFVVDCADRERFDEARDELYNVINHPDMYNVPVEIIANKQDLIGAMKPQEVMDKLKLKKSKHLQWHVQGACATSGIGLHEAMESLVTMIKIETQRQASFRLPEGVEIC